MPVEASPQEVAMASICMKRKPIGWLWTMTGPLDASFDGPNCDRSCESGLVPRRLAAAADGACVSIVPVDADVGVVEGSAPVAFPLVDPPDDVPANNAERVARASLDRVWAVTGRALPLANRFPRAHGQAAFVAVGELEGEAAGAPPV
eukprot:6473194-Heterocapsa_arctica.AAC.1